MELSYEKSVNHSCIFQFIYCVYAVIIKCVILFFCDLNFLWTISSLNFEPLDLARIFIVFAGHGVRDFFNREKREIKNREKKYQ